MVILVGAFTQNPSVGRPLLLGQGPSQKLWIIPPVAYKGPKVRAQWVEVPGTMGAFPDLASPHCEGLPMHVCRHPRPRIQTLSTPSTTETCLLLTPWSPLGPRVHTLHLSLERWPWERRLRK